MKQFRLEHEGAAGWVVVCGWEERRSRLVELRWSDPKLALEHASLRIARSGEPSGAFRVVPASGRRVNPRRVVSQTRWIWFKRKGKYNPKLRPFAHGQSGCYAFRVAATGAVLYVGESHTGRLWKTSIRHFQGLASGKFEFAHSRSGDPTEWVHGRPELLECRYWICDPEDAVELEAELILALAPAGNAELDALHEDEDEDEDEVPF